jgi:hypothetical protein
MNTTGKVAWWLAALLLAGQLVGAEPSQDDTTPVADRQQEQEVGTRIDSGRAQRIKIKKGDLKGDLTIGVSRCAARSVISISDFREKDAKGGDEQ